MPENLDELERLLQTQTAPEVILGPYRGGFELGAIIYEGNPTVSLKVEGTPTGFEKTVTLEGRVFPLIVEGNYTRQRVHRSTVKVKNVSPPPIRSALDAYGFPPLENDSPI